MKKIITLFAFLSIIICLVYGAYLFVPGYIYGKLVRNSMENSWYSLNSYSPKYLKSKKLIKLDSVKVENEFFWRRFNFGNISLPLPVKNPFYFVTPSINDVKGKTNLGIRINNAKNEKIAEILLLESHDFYTDFNSQKLFELPLVQEIITKKTHDEIWMDIFTYDISLFETNIEKMLYSLYILYQRSKYLPQNHLGFGALEGQDKVSIKLNYPDKDYSAELIHSRRGDKVFSIVLIRKINDAESELIRYKVVKDIQYLQNSSSLVDIIIKEFQGLKYSEQIDHVGMLYLLSAWSYDFTNKGILENLIFYLERGVKNQAQLKPLYEYYLARYGEIYTKRKVDNLDLSFEALLKRDISLEKQRERLKELNPQSEIIKPKKRSLSQEFDIMIEKTKVKEAKNQIKID